MLLVLSAVPFLIVGTMSSATYAQDKTDPRIAHVTTDGQGSTPPGGNPTVGPPRGNPQSQPPGTPTARPGTPTARPGVPTGRPGTPTNAPAAPSEPCATPSTRPTDIGRLRGTGPSAIPPGPPSTEPGFPEGVPAIPRPAGVPSDPSVPADLSDQELAQRQNAMAWAVDNANRARRGLNRRSFRQFMYAEHENENVPVEEGGDPPPSEAPPAPASEPTGDPSGGLSGSGSGAARRAGTQIGIGAIIWFIIQRLPIGPVRTMSPMRAVPYVITPGSRPGEASNDRPTKCRRGLQVAYRVSIPRTEQNGRSSKADGTAIATSCGGRSGPWHLSVALTHESEDSLAKTEGDVYHDLDFSLRNDSENKVRYAATAGPVEMLNKETKATALMNLDEGAQAVSDRIRLSVRRKGQELSFTSSADGHESSFDIPFRPTSVRNLCG